MLDFWLVVNQNFGPQASDLARDWLMMLMMSSTNGGFERHKVRLVLVDEFPGFYMPKIIFTCFSTVHSEPLQTRDYDSTVFHNGPAGLLKV